MLLASDAAAFLVLLSVDLGGFLLGHLAIGFSLGDILADLGLLTFQARGFFGGELTVLDARVGKVCDSTVGARFRSLRTDGELISEAQPEPHARPDEDGRRYGREEPCSFVIAFAHDEAGMAGPGAFADKPGAFLHDHRLSGTPAMPEFAFVPTVMSEGGKAQRQE